MGNKIAMNALSVGSENRPKRFKDANGFLHVFLRVMRTGTLKYSPATYQDSAPPDAIGTDGMIAVMVTPGELSNPESIASLKGMPGLRKHEVATPEAKKDIIGAVAGEPEYVTEGETGYVECEAVITDAATIESLDAGDLVEVSGSYHHAVDWNQGEYKGVTYAGEQVGIRYNHFVLLPKGEGRAGSDVVVLNSKENENVDKFMVWSRRQNKIIVAMNEDDAKAIAKLDDEATAKNEAPESKDKPTPAAPPKAEGSAPAEGGAVAGGETNGDIKNLGKLLEELTKVKARAAELEGQLQVAQEKINELLSPDKIESEVNSMATEREEAVEVMADNGIDKAVAMNSIKEQKLRGHALRVFAMNSIREKQGKAKVDEAKAGDESFVMGMWNGVKENAGNHEKKHVIGGVAFNSTSMTNYNDYKANALKTLGF